MSYIRKVFSWWLYLLFALLYIMLAAVEARTNSTVSCMVCLVFGFICANMSIAAYKDQNTGKKK